MTLVFTGNLFAHTDRVYRDPKFVAELAAFYGGLALSGEATLDWVIAQLYDVHQGDLFDHRDRWLDPGALAPEILWGRRQLKSSKALKRMRTAMWGEASDWRTTTMDVSELFGVDTARTMNHFKTLAHKPLKTPLARYLVPRVMILDFARRIYEGAQDQSSAA